ncbi:unnamed protein product [Camellia sinensis]
MRDNNTVNCYTWSYLETISSTDNCCILSNSLANSWHFQIWTMVIDGSRRKANRQVGCAWVCYDKSVSSEPTSCLLIPTITKCCKSKNLFGSCSMRCANESYLFYPSLQIAKCWWILLEGHLKPDWMMDSVITDIKSSI